MRMDQPVLLKNGKSLGEGVFVIAEVGVNHNGDFQLASEMVEVAARCGADAVKFQTFRTEEFLTDKNLMHTYTQNGKQVTESQWDMFKRLEMPFSWYPPLFEQAEKAGMIPFTSIADSLSLEKIRELDLPLIKLASEDLINIDILDAVKDFPAPIILSTGMANEEEISGALFRLNRRDVGLLHCVSLYPAPVEELNLARMQSLQKRFGCITGFSDHSGSLISGAVAVACGATVIEKHFTMSHDLPGPDHAFSLDPDELEIYIRNIRDAEKMAGDGHIEPHGKEAEMAKTRRGITCIRDLPAGTRIQRRDIAFQRPCPYLKPYQIDRVLDAVTLHDMKKGDKIRESDLAWD